jgi:hypothetical protein
MAIENLWRYFKAYKSSITVPTCLQRINATWDDLVILAVDRSRTPLNVHLIRQTSCFLFKDLIRFKDNNSCIFSDNPLNFSFREGPKHWTNLRKKCVKLFGLLIEGMHDISKIWGEPFLAKQVLIYVNNFLKRHNEKIEVIVYALVKIIPWLPLPSIRESCLLWFLRNTLVFFFFFFFFFTKNAFFIF